MFKKFMDDKRSVKRIVTPISTLGFFVPGTGFPQT